MRNRAEYLASRQLRVLLCGALVAAALVAIAQFARGVPSLADTAPPASTTPTVSADALPTVQINGVVWSQVTVGNTVYATGSFTSARPAGSPAGTNETPRGNLLAYDITSGNLITTFNHSLNGQGLVITASTDHSTIYVGGDFTAVDGKAHQRIAAFNTSNGALINGFAPTVNDSVNAIAASGSVVYLGGKFTTVNGLARTRLAALSSGTGALLSWAPSATGGLVDTMVLTPSGAKVIVGGQFTSVNNTAAAGLSALDPNDGSLLPWAATAKVQDSGNSAGIYNLSTDGSQVYGTGFVFGPGGNLEGTFAADPDTGAINWIEDCHGDTYGAFTLGQAVYTVSHSHYCGNIGGFPQTTPSWTFYRATAFTSYPTQTVAHNSSGGYFDWYGNPAPTQLDWYPNLFVGTYTGQNQAAWSISGNSSYITLGGEFPRVNGSAQQGLVRFAVASVAPNIAGPRPSDALTPTVSSVSPGSVRLAFKATWDQDNALLTYKVVRDGHVSSPVYTTTVDSRFWILPSINWMDTGLVPGSSHTYRVYVYDPFGNSTTGHTVTAVVASGSPSVYVQDVLNDGASNYWRLDDASGSTFTDAAGTDSLTKAGGITLAAQGAIANGDAAAEFDGSSGTAGGVGGAQGPTTFTIESWFQTTTSQGGKLVGFGDSQTGISSNYDRHIYMDNAGHIVFGVYPNAVRTISSSGTYNDGNWHQAVASLSSAGMVLYIDGQAVANDPTTTSAQSYSGDWRIGGDNLDGWTSRPSSRFFSGTLDDIAIYPTALTANEVSSHYSDSSVGNSAPTAAFTDSCVDLNCSFDGSSSSDRDGAVQSYAWDFGDGATSTASAPTHSFAAAGDYPVTLTVQDDRGATNSVTRTVTATVRANEPPVAAFGESCTALACGFDATGSTDADGSVVSYQWSFGDRSTGSGAQPTHTYALAGDYPVTVTVTDNDGATAVATTTVSVVAPANQPPPPFASDSFARTVSNGFGTADSGGAWTGTVPADMSVSNGAASILLPQVKTLVNANLFSVSRTDAELRTSFTTDKLVGGSGAYAWAIGRRTSFNNEYRARIRFINHSVAVELTMLAGSATEVPLTNEVTLAGGSYSPGTQVNVDFQVTGTNPASLRLKVWPATSSEPTGWTLTATDSTPALQARGSVGVAAYLAGTSTGAPATVQAGRFTATPTFAPPFASFATSGTGSSYSVDATGSSDPNGSALQYGWVWGDGTETSGVASNHTFDAPGTYRVTLTVTDASGWTSTTSQTVTV